jgi:predicted site-specific integrase-resolvase
VSDLFSGADSPRLHTTDIARVLGVSTQTVLVWSRRGILPAPRRLNARVLIWPREETAAAVRRILGEGAVHA